MGNGDGSPYTPSPASHINKALFGLLMFIGSEIMVFSGMVSSFLILRAGTTTWPPVDQPRLPVAVTGINTLFLLLSGVAMYMAVRSIKRGQSGSLLKWLSGTVALGATFLGIQGFEWFKLVGFGMTFSSSVYGGIFYVLIGFHALHVFGAMLGLLVVVARTSAKKYTKYDCNGVMMCAAYWFFVVGVWPVIYALVYLA